MYNGNYLFIIVIIIIIVVENCLLF